MRTIPLLPATAPHHHLPEVASHPGRTSEARHNSALGHLTCREMTHEENVSQENNMGETYSQQQYFQGKKSYKE